LEIDCGAFLIDVIIPPWQQKELISRAKQKELELMAFDKGCKLSKEDLF